MSFEYPRTDWDRKDVLMPLLGSFWDRTFDARSQIESLVFSRAQLEAQAHQDLLELAACGGRLTVPVLHRRQWSRILLKEGDKNATAAALLRYGESAVFSDDSPYKFGVPYVDRSLGYIWPWPVDIREASVICNRLTNPSLTLFEGIDYEVDLPNERIIFRSDPFESGLLSVREVFIGSEVQDREATLWVYRAGHEKYLPYYHAAYVLGNDHSIKEPSSQGYKSLVNSVLDAFVLGTARRQLEGVLSSITDAPQAAGDETVELVTRDEVQQLIVTDKNVYRVSLTAVPDVAAGDDLVAGQPVTDVWRINEFNRGQVPAGLRALVLGRDWLIPGYVGELVFENEDTAIIAELVAGRVKVSFNIGGFPADVTKFWDDLHERGLAKGKTLAQLLDTRTSPTDDPPAGALPATINPLQFLCEQVLRHNAFLVRIRTTSAGERKLSLSHLQLLRKIIPPHTAMLVVAELASQEGPVILSESDEASSLGAVEAVSRSLSADSIQDIIDFDDDPFRVSESPRARYAHGYCV